jgi:hypothetical protein
VKNRQAKPQGKEPFADAEFKALLNAAPTERKLWYRTAAATGFRLNELRMLTTGSIREDGLFLPAEHTKERKDALQPLPATLQKALAKHCAERARDMPLLDIPDWGAHELLKEDLVASRRCRRGSEDAPDPDPSRHRQHRPGSIRPCR